MGQKLIIREIEAKSLLDYSQIYAYCLNLYTGCQIGCSYCYARLVIPRYSRHKEPWGNFVDVKMNAVERLKTQVCKAKKG